MSDDDFDPWWRDALCAELGPDLFFLKEKDSSVEARAACRLCPVRINCLTDALESRLEHGIFGGFGRNARRAMNDLVEAGAEPRVVATTAIHRERRRHVTGEPAATRRRAVAR